MNRIDIKAKTSLHAIHLFNCIERREPLLSAMDQKSFYNYAHEIVISEMARSKPRERTVVKICSCVTQKARFFIFFLPPPQFLFSLRGNETNYETPHGDFHRQSEAPDENPNPTYARRSQNSDRVRFRG